MHALKDLLTTDYGLMSVGVIALTLGLGGFYLRYFLNHIRDESARHAASLAAKR
ncbi:DUF3149 domain-containing protein [Azohydromonas aeria]|uniref:DUF3149 domain-containing protein n=1 Tax=Azohydromonas aeria TaxID=2590212 RepID=UPI0012F83D49|nr:DUF3149 domain-containing protein [Azohydromonas aeria]